MDAQRAIVLGVHSFFDSGPRVGTQYIAQGLANNGWTVDYVSVGSSPFDIFRRDRRKRLRRVWIDRQDKKGLIVKPGLTEYAFRTLHPAHKFFLNSSKSLERYSCLAPAWLQDRHYEICIHDITANILFLSMIQANLWVLRLNDSPEGFAFHIHKKLIECFKAKIASVAYHEIWAVSDPLLQYALDLNPANQVVVLPNGIEGRFLKVESKVERLSKKAVYLGDVAPWVDLKLVEQTAILLPDWQFDIYGSSIKSNKRRSKNINLFGPVEREKITTLLSEYQVGLIPFRDVCGRMNYVERPLKFYEYIAAGLGVACTDTGALKKGLGRLACFGNTPDEYAAAIVKAAVEKNARTPEFNRSFIKKNSWKTIISRMCSRIEDLQIRQKNILQSK